MSPGVALVAGTGLLLEEVLLIGLLVGVGVLVTMLGMLDVRHANQNIPENADWVREQLAVTDPMSIVSYRRATVLLNAVRRWLFIVLILGALSAGIVTDAVELLADTGWHPAIQGLVFAAGLTVLFQVLNGLFDLYDTFAIDERFGFNEQSVGLWARDFVISLVLVSTIVSAISGLVFWLVVEVSTVTWVVGGWLIVLGFTLLMQVLGPRVLLPLFYEIEPVEDEQLRAAIEDVFDRAGFETPSIHSMNASSRSTRQSAFFTGFGETKQIVLYDTLIDNLDLPQIKGVLAHEMAHWRYRHSWKLTATAALRAAVVFAVLGAVVAAGWPSAAFGFPAGTPYADVLVGLVYAYPVVVLTRPMTNLLSFRLEREADLFATDVMDASEPIATAVATVYGSKKANPYPHPWYELFYNNHPSVPERVRYIRDHVGSSGSDQQASDGGVADTTSR